LLRFDHPGNLGSCLRDTYEYLRPALENILGYPVSLESIASNNTPSAASARQDDGSLLIRLPGPSGEIGRTFLCLSYLASQDAYCRRVAGCFVRMCARIAGNAGRSWDIKAQLIREEQFLWDNLVLSLFYAGNQKYNALDLLGTAREAGTFRYEGAPVRLGLVATWNWYQLRPLLEKRQCLISDFVPSFDLRNRLKRDKASHLLTDGISSFYVVNSSGSAISWIVLGPASDEQTPETWEAVPRAYSRINEHLIGRDMTIVVNRHGELLLFCRDVVLKWNRSGWHRVAGPSLSSILVPYCPAEVAGRLVVAAVRLSDRRQGALFVLTHDANSTLAAGSSGIAKHFGNVNLFNIADVDVETLCQVARIDGAVIVSRLGMVLNAGVILKLSDGFARTEQGARSAAAAFASAEGVALKVSHDGPISIFKNGSEVRRAG